MNKKRRKVIEKKVASVVLTALCAETFLTACNNIDYINQNNSILSKVMDNVLPEPTEVPTPEPTPPPQANYNLANLLKGGTYKNISDEFILKNNHVARWVSLADSENDYPGLLDLSLGKFIIQPGLYKKYYQKSKVSMDIII